jgi:uncharacterized Zn finger protein (UPF0148 family)
MAKCQRCKEKVSYWSGETHCGACKSKIAAEHTEKSRLSADAKERQKALMIEESAPDTLPSNDSPNVDWTEMTQAIDPLIISSSSFTFWN